jgi:hypothetical protein
MTDYSDFFALSRSDLVVILPEDPEVGTSFTVRNDDPEGKMLTVQPGSFLLRPTESAPFVYAEVPVWEKSAVLQRDKDGKMVTEKRWVRFNW